MLYLQKGCYICIVIQHKCFVHFIAFFVRVCLYVCACVYEMNWIKTVCLQRCKGVGNYSYDRFTYIIIWDSKYIVWTLLSCEKKCIQR